VNGLRPDGIDLDRPVLAASGTAAASCEAPAAALAEIDLAEARALHAAGATFVDARPASTYAEGHVPDALHLPSNGECPDGPALIEDLRGRGTVVVYDDGASCALARRLADRLIAEGLADVRLMIGGFTGWQRAGEAAQSGTCAACGLRAEGE